MPLNILNMKETEERRIKCSTCGYELTYPEFVHGDKCAFHAELQPISLIAWLKFALADWRIYNHKLKMREKGEDAAMFYKACVGNCSRDVADLTDHKQLDRLFFKLKNYKPQEEA